jgi:chromosome segregation ATPase
MLTGSIKESIERSIERSKDESRDRSKEGYHKDGYQSIQSKSIEVSELQDPFLDLLDTHSPQSEWPQSDSFLLHDKYAQLVQEHQDTLHAVHAAEAQILSISTAKTSLEADYSHLQKQLENFRQDYDDLVETLEEYEINFESLKQLSDNQSVQNSDLKAQIAHSNNEIAALMTQKSLDSSMSAELSLLKSQLAESSKLSLVLQDKHADIESALAVALADCNSFKLQNTDLQLQISLLQDSLHEMNQNAFLQMSAATPLSREIFNTTQSLTDAGTQIDTVMFSEDEVLELVDYVGSTPQIHDQNVLEFNTGGTQG